MNGAVQGVATTAASTPVKKVPTQPWRGQARAQAGQGAADVEQACQAQCHQEEQHRDDVDEHRRMELEAPADLLPPARSATSTAPSSAKLASTPAV